MKMYLLCYIVPLLDRKERERRKRSENVLVKLYSHRYCKERKKGINERDNFLAILCGHKESCAKVLEICILWYEYVPMTVCR